jgi:hypothetical protein
MGKNNNFCRYDEVWIKLPHHKRRLRGDYVRFDENEQKHVVASGVYHYYLDDNEVEAI